MADQQAQNGADKATAEAKSSVDDLTFVVRIEGGKANQAVKYYLEVFGAKELNVNDGDSERKRKAEMVLTSDSEKKRKAEMELTIDSEKKRTAEMDESLNKAVLLQFGSLQKLLVVDCVKEESSTSDQKTFNLVFEGNPEIVVEKAVNAGWTVVGDDVAEDLASAKTTNSGTTVKDPFGFSWNIAGKKVVTETTGAGVEDAIAESEGLMLTYDPNNNDDIGQHIAEQEHDDILQGIDEMDNIDVVAVVENDEGDDDNGDSLLHVYAMPRGALPEIWRNFWIEDLDKDNFNEVQSIVEAVQQILRSRDGGVVEPEYFFIHEQNQEYLRLDDCTSWDWEQFDTLVDGAVELVDGA